MIFSYSITAAGSYVQRAGRYKRDKDSTKLFQLSWNPSMDKPKDRSRRSMDGAYRHLFRNARPSMVESFATMLRGNKKHEEIAAGAQTYSSGTPSGTTELDLHVAESVLVPGDMSIVDRCAGKEAGKPLTLWPSNCVPLAIEAPSTLRLRAKIGVSWSGQYILRLSPRDDDIWDMPLRQCGSIDSRNPRLRIYLRKSLGLKYGLASSAISIDRTSLYLTIFVLSLHYFYRTTSFVLTNLHPSTIM